MVIEIENVNDKMLDMLIAEHKFAQWVKMVKLV